MASLLVKEPIYQQLNTHLRLLVSSGECTVGSKFLTERQICERYSFNQPLTRSVPWEWLYMSRTVRFSDDHVCYMHLHLNAIVTTIILLLYL